MAELNAQAIASLKEGNKDEAIATLSRALISLRGLATSVSSEVARAADILEVTTFSVPIAEAPRDKKLFSRAFVIPSESSDDMLVESAAVIFNIALAHNFKFEDTRSQAKALKLYEKVLRLVSTYEMISSNLAAIWLASCNNMVHLQERHGNRTLVLQAQTAFMLAYDAVRIGHGGPDFAFFHERVAQIHLNLTKLPPTA